MDLSQTRRKKLSPGGSSGREIVTIHCPPGATRQISLPGFVSRRSRLERVELRGHLHGYAHSRPFIFESVANPADAADGDSERGLAGQVAQEESESLASSKAGGGQRFCADSFDQGTAEILAQARKRQGRIWRAE